jgi:hypothetical protein
MPSNSKMPDAGGLVVLALEMFLTVRLARDHEILSWIWILVYVVFAIVGIYAWHDKKAPQTPAGWLLFAVGTVILGAVFFAFDIGAGHSEHPKSPTCTRGQTSWESAWLWSDPYREPRINNYFHRGSCTRLLPGQKDLPNVKR